MPTKHGVYTTQAATGVSTPSVADSGIPFVVGAAPVQSADNYSAAALGLPVLCTSFAEAKAALGYSDDFEHYDLCEVMYTHFQLFGCQPVILCNMLNPATMKATVAATDISLTDHKALLPIDAINDASLVVKPSTSGSALTKGTDYEAYYSGENLVVEAIEGGGAYSAAKLNIAYNKVDTSKVTKTVVAGGFAAVDSCMSTVGTVPDLLLAPKYSSDSEVAAVMATKAGGINGMFGAKALVDLDTATANSYTAAVSTKADKGMTDANEIVCWPMATLGDRKLHMSCIVAGRMAATDTDNAGVPYESPSNKDAKIDGLCLADGTAVVLTFEQANALNGGGIVTALNFMGAWKVWGNYTGCYPSSTDPKDMFIPCGRMFAYVQNTIIRTCWQFLDKPMNRRLLDTITDTVNIWLNGLVGSGYLLGARVEISEDENPVTQLMAGIIKIHVYMTTASPAQEIDFVLEYDSSYVTSALTA